MLRIITTIVVVVCFPITTNAQDRSLSDLPLNTWVKLTPLDDTPPSPRLGYEGDCRWAPAHQKMLRYGGHNQGGGGEQGSEVWLFDPRTAKWELRHPNISPPGVCCAQQNVYDPVGDRYIRFPAFSHSHGWQWMREVYLNNTSVWTFDIATNTWRNMRPLPEPPVRPLRCASWDSHHEVVVMFGGEGGREGTLVYDPYTNTWERKRPAKEPQPRSAGNMAYDEARKLHILFGAQFQDDPHTWAYSLEKNEWVDMKPPSQPPTNRNDAVLTYDPFNKVVIAIVKVSTGEDENARHELQTWAYDAGKNAWRKMNPATEPDPSGNRARQLMFAPRLGAAMLENRSRGSKEQQIWVYRHDEAVVSESPAVPRLMRDAPRIVEDVTVSVVNANRVELSWQPPREGNAVAYHVERAAVEVLTTDQLRTLKDRTPPLDEPSVGAIRGIGRFERITKQPIAATAFVDETVGLTNPARIEGEPIHERSFDPAHVDEAGKPYRYGVYAYRVIARSANGKASGPSPATLTIPSPPQHVFAKEGEGVAHLKWAANPEKNIAGYRVYRLDGRWNKQAVSRLTPDPIAATTFDDQDAGKSSRRYHIIAVDALGQEGFPSSPVWYDREWKAYYTPFVGQWHQ